MQEHHYRPPGTIPLSLQKSSTSMVATNIAAGEFRTRVAKGSMKAEKSRNGMPSTATVNACRRLAEDNVALEKYPLDHNRLSNLSSRGVDSTSVEDICSLKNLFEKGALKQTATIEAVSSPIICAPRITRPVAGHPQSSRAGSPILKQSSQPAQGIPASLSFNNRQNSHNTAHEPSPPLLESEGSTFSKTTALSDHENALLAATLVVQPKISKGSTLKPQPPKLPPPRRGQNNLKVPNGKTLESEDISDALSDGSVKTGCSKYETARSSTPLKPSLSGPALPISLLPERRFSLGNVSHQTTCNKTLTVVSAAASSTAPHNTTPAHQGCDQPLPLPQNLAGDSVIATSLVQSRVNSLAPREPPAPPAPRRGRRKSLPPPPKTGLRKTIREPKSLPSEANSQSRMPNIVKHHPHEDEGERGRWMYFINDVERKRYEGLWAANKGLLLATCDLSSKGPMPDSLGLHRAKGCGPHGFQLQEHVWSSTPSYTESLPDCVDSLVARDIWIRSRLPPEYLAGIWDLVDRGMKGRLSRDEFVVGTWLIDQSLKGRKLPKSVQATVWQSVRRQSVKIPSPVGNSVTY